MAFSLFKKKAEKKDDRYKHLRVKEVVNIAKDAINIVFEQPRDFSYQPGQFLTIMREVNGKKIRRAYSLNSTPFQDANPSVTVKRVAGGQMSNYLNDHLRAGDVLEVMEPMGLFITDYHEDKQRTAVFFGGGSGITPLISIIRSILLKEPNSKTVLVYANRSEEYIIFRELIAKLKEEYADRFVVKHILENGEADYEGRLSLDIISDLDKSLKLDDSTQYFICGPQPMMDIVVESLKKLGKPADNIRLESFEAGKTSPLEIRDKKSVEKSEVTILLDGEEYMVMVKKTESILDVALDNDLDMPYSCQSGLCTACRGKCKEGEVSTDDAEGLSQEELDDGYVLTCVGKPVSNRVKIEVG